MCMYGMWIGCGQGLSPLEWSLKISDASKQSFDREKQMPLFQSSETNVVVGQETPAAQLSTMAIGGGVRESYKLRVIVFVIQLLLKNLITSWHGSNLYTLILFFDILMCCSMIIYCTLNIISSLHNGVSNGY